MTTQNQYKTSVQKELENRILHGLSCEWDAALWILERSHRRMMKKPRFSLGDFSSKLGYWSLCRNEIRLSRHLVLHHPWDAVREVLLHEMAHQMAHQVLHAGNETPHGPIFKKACGLLRADPKASGRYPPLDEKVFEHQDSDDDKRLLRIKKLMALAGSQNRHEAEAAMVKAHELIGKYNIGLLEMNEKRFFHSIFLGTPRLRQTRDQYHLARLLCDFYFVDGIWVPAYVIEKEKMGRVLEITGTRSNIKIAAYVYNFVQHYIYSRWDAYNQRRRLNHHRKTDFAVGVIEGFMGKLNQQGEKKKIAGAEKSLMKIEDPLLKKHMAYKYPHTTQFYRNASGQDDGVVRDGVQAGKAMVISKGISQKTKARNILKING